MTNVIVFTNAKGGVSVCYPTGDIPIDQVQSKDIPAGVESFIVDVNTLPNDDFDFFDAWEHVDGVVTINLDKAKTITKDRLRYERTALLSEQDVAFQRAIEIGADTSAIVAEKRRLRDITLLADSCTTLAELRALHP